MPQLLRKLECQQFTPLPPLSFEQQKGAWGKTTDDFSIIYSKRKTYALECTVHFLIEERTEAYWKYAGGVLEMKNVLGAKSIKPSPALLDLA